MQEGKLMEKMKKRAEAYVPEWSFDLENPDMGVALAKVFERMQGKTEEKYNRLIDKYQRDFFNCLNTSMKSSAPASGYAVFGLSGTETGGTELPSGTPLLTDVTDDYGERIPVETMEEVYVIPDPIEAIYECSDSDDYIGMLYDREKDFQEFSLFVRESENLQEHVFYMGHPHILSIRQYGSVRLTLLGAGGEVLSEEIMRAFCDPAKAEFFYLTQEDGVEEVPFGLVKREGSSLIMEKKGDGKSWEPVELSGKISCWLGCRIFQKEGFENLSLGEVYLSSACGGVFPELMYADGAEKKGGTFYPFGEQPSFYGEFYVSSQEVLGKKGSVVELSFEREFARIPISSVERDNEPKWKLVMPKETMNREKEYEITIEEVVWEYFNGLGWTSLFENGEYSDVFSCKDGRYRQARHLRFQCPMDICPILVNSLESYWIRARIRKVNNAFKTNGVYVVPVLSGMLLRYQYEDRQLEPQYFYVKNNGSGYILHSSECLGKLNGFFPVKGTGEKKHVVYLGLKEVFEQGPVRMLWIMEKDYESYFSDLTWEYYSNGRWKALNVSDETGSFARTGLISFPGMPKAQKLVMFEKNLYWIRIVDKEDIFKKGKLRKPIVEKIWMNGTKVATVRTGIEERLTMEGYETKKQFQLLNHNIYYLEVWVMEQGIRSESEFEQLKKDGFLEQVTDGDGTIKETWIKWEETDNFRFHKPADRVYMLDANEGTLIFGGGEHGAIPAPGIVGGIKVRYSIGGGKRCNLLPGQILGLELATGFINMVTNPLPLSGGYGRESAEEAMKRAGCERKHQFRLVSEADFEAMATEATRNIEKVRCFSGRDMEGEERIGTATLVILKKDYKAGGRFFQEMRNQIRTYMKDKLPVAMTNEDTLFIREPVLAEVELQVTVVSQKDGDLFGLRRRIEQRIRQFLDPVSGNFDGCGWEIGTLPDRVQMETVIRSVEGLLELKSLVVFIHLINEPKRQRAQLEEVKKHFYVLPVSGEHQILVLPK